jgi:hypothetical protein
MKTKRATLILQALVQGTDPNTGDELPSPTVLQHGDVLRALLVALAALEYYGKREQRRDKLPGNVGRSWTQDEENALSIAFKKGDALTDIATRHGRTRRAIEARLLQLGLIAPEQRKTA